MQEALAARPLPPEIKRPQQLDSRIREAQMDTSMQLKAAGKGKKTVKAQQFWSRIREVQMGTITLPVLYKTMRIANPNTCTLERFIARVVHRDPGAHIG